MVLLRNKREAIKGIIYMSLFFSWLLFIPFYGSSQHLIADSLYLTYSFSITHILGMLHAGWFYLKYPSHNHLQKFPKVMSFLFLVSGIIALIASSPYLDKLAFLGMGYTCAWIVIFWGTWLSSMRLSFNRGLIMGSTLALTNILLLIYTLLCKYISHLSIFIIFSSLCLSFVGALLICQLEIFKERKIEKVESEVKVGTNIRADFKKNIPPLKILLFGVIAFSAGGFLYDVVNSAQAIVLPYAGIIVLAVYIVSSLIFGLISDKYSKEALLSAVFCFIGIGFAFWQTGMKTAALHTIASSLIIIGLACADLYYWLSLTEYGEKTERSSMVLAGGLSVHLIAITFTGIATEKLVINPQTSYSVVGLVGVITMFLGIILFFGVFGNFFTYSDPSYQIVAEISAASEKESVQKNDNCNNNPAQAKMESTDIRDVNTLKKLLTTRYGMTEREQEMTILLIQGYSYSQISKDLHVSNNTIKYHVKNILGKTEATNRYELSKEIWDLLPDIYS